MKIPNRIVGFISHEDKELPFEFDKNEFLLKFYYPTESDAYEHIFDGVKAMTFDLKKHEWIPKIKYTGKTAEGYLVVFGTTDNPSDYHGYRTYGVEWFYITNDDSETIDEISITGREVDYFFPPSKTFTQNLKFKEDDKYSIEKMSVDAVRVVDYDCGQYELDGKIVAIKISAYPTMHTNSDSPFDAKSYMYLKFSQGLILDEVINKSLTAMQFIKYVCYRNNDDIPEIQTYIKNDEGKYENCGCICFKFKHDEEKHPKAKERIISAEMLGIHTAEIMKAIDEGKISLGHLCKSIEDTRHYPISRIIMILSSFEREFRNIYGQDVRRSDEYARTKEEVINCIKEYADSVTGKRKRYAKNFAKGIENSDSSYGDNVKYAFEDCKDIMYPFVVRRYEGDYENIIDDVSMSINTLRNGIAHSRLDLELEARYLTDIKFIEELLYVIRLKSIEIDETVIQKAVNQLFHENIAF